MRTPMTSIKNAVDLILKGKAGDITDTQEKFLCMAKRNIERLARLINDLLVISKIEAGRMELRHAEMDLKGCIENVVDTFVQLANEKSISIKVRIDIDVPAFYADASKIEDVLINLIDNAIKFTPKNKTITIDARELKDGADIAQGSDRFLQISVMDEGIGIPNQRIEQIFDKFVQVESTLSRQKGTGTGLGLAICKYIIEAHGGKIQCESKEGEGSTFSFTLPIIDKMDN
jgi:signal transduction histidine kinase